MSSSLSIRALAERGLSLAQTGAEKVSTSLIGLVRKVTGCHPLLVLQNPDDWVAPPIPNGLIGTLTITGGKHTKDEKLLQSLRSHRIYLTEEGDFLSPEGRLLGTASRNGSYFVNFYGPDSAHNDSRIVVRRLKD